ncbi:class I SAM-dependent methyltransferase [Roseomonas sp. CAU 1739]|uniref:class I SAM-dependent methyltransferase n=1 Tax=Roseomonas sp. CAU 1739 TaxID=3140364 RepID=UPI00325BDFF6
MADRDSDLQCPRCGAALEALTCTGCGAAYSRVLGVPFIGDFEAADALGLIEIVANAPNRASLVIAAGVVEQIDALCAGFHAAGDKDAFRATHAEAQAPWFSHRYAEWQAVETLLTGIDLTGKDVLDIGAGQGFDAWRLALRGARVTALEFSPVVAEAGSTGFPSLRWVGGFGHALPFRAAAFDHVFVNAALHHMRDIPATIAEALRVLRPGGTLITTGDPFRADGADQSLEFDIFDRHEAVLLGINEQIPRAGDFLATLEAHRAILAPELFTQVLYGGRSGDDPALTDWTAWDFDADAALLKARSGTLAMRVRLLAAWLEDRAMQRDGVLSPATFAGWLDDPVKAVAELARIVPRALLDTPFPGPPAKFDLINGWRVKQSTARTRTAHRRARLFRTRGAARVLLFQMRSSIPAAITLRVNARPVGRATIGPVWTLVEANVDAVPAGEPFLLEFQREGEPADFDSGDFQVRLPGLLARLTHRIRTSPGPRR